MFYMAIPYLILAALATGYLLFRRRRTGRVTFKVRQTLFNRVNLDLLLTVVLICLLCAFFLWSDLNKYNEIAAAGNDVESRWIYGARIVFYLLLAAVFGAKQLERPALRERGISSARWFWPWNQIKSYRWNGLVLQFKIRTARKEITESWSVAPEQKQELDRLLRQNIKKQEKKTGKKKPARR
jgi:hypothetical protein